MSTTDHRKTSLPMVRLNLARPFLDAAMDSGRRNLDGLIEPFGIATVNFDDPDKFVPAPTMYDLVETLAAATDDPYIGVHLGTQLDPFSWSPLTAAAENAHSVGDLLLRFSIDAYRDATSVVFHLETEGARTTFSEDRLTDGGRLPRHNDGFGVAYIVSILRSALGTHWHGREVLANVCDPTVFPEKYCDIRLAKGDTNGFSVSFPCQWLLLEPQLKPVSADKHTAPGTVKAPTDTLTALWHILDSHLHEPGLDSERVALLCGMSKRTLHRRLAAMDTSLKQELDQIRMQKAKTELAASTEPISHIGERLGYPDPSVFTRTFRRWTGKSPSEFRESEAGSHTRAG